MEQNDGLASMASAPADLAPHTKGRSAVVVDVPHDRTKVHVADLVNQFRAPEATGRAKKFHVHARSTLDDLVVCTELPMDPPTPDSAILLSAHERMVKAMVAQQVPCTVDGHEPLIVPAVGRIAWILIVVADSPSVDEKYGAQMIRLEDLQDFFGVLAGVIIHRPDNPVLMAINDFIRMWQRRRNRGQQKQNRK